MNSLNLLFTYHNDDIFANGTYFALLGNFGDSPSFMSSFDLWVPSLLQVPPRRCKLLPRIRRSVLLRSHSKCLRIQSLSKRQPCVNCEPQDVEALLNGGSLIDAPCISVPEEHLLQAICRSQSWLQFDQFCISGDKFSCIHSVDRIYYMRTLYLCMCYKLQTARMS